MPIDPISLTMMIGSVGLNFLTNSKNSKKQAELQAKQKEFQIAQANHDLQRMREIQERAAQLNREIEAELHAQRLEDIRSNYDDIIDQIAKDKVLKNWPITLLPFVMKGERLGNFIGSSIQPIVMHCILTPSNNKWFNDNIYRDLDYQIQAYINNDWHSHSTHPVFYHGGGWKTNKEIDLNQIDQLKACLKAVPTMVITPYFDVDTALLYFRISMWGMGRDCNTKLYPQTDDFENRVFSYNYVYGELPPENADEIEFKKTTIEEFVPYIICLIGFVADKYYWSLYNLLPVLPAYFKERSDLFNCDWYSHCLTNLYLDEIKSMRHQLSDCSVSYTKCVQLIDFISPYIKNIDFSSFLEDIKIYKSASSNLEEPSFKKQVKYIEFDHEKFDIQDLLIDLNNAVNTGIDFNIVITRKVPNTMLFELIGSNNNHIESEMGWGPYKVTFCKLRREKIIKLLFKNSNDGSIVITSSKLQSFIEKLNTLVF